jgi:hypothetical protein
VDSQHYGTQSYTYDNAGRPTQISSPGVGGHALGLYLIPIDGADVLYHGAGLIIKHRRRMEAYKKIAFDDQGHGDAYEQG